MRLRPLTKQHGGKYYLAEWIVSFFPSNYRELVYVEPYAGMASVLLRKDKSRVEILNDLDEKVVALLATVRDDHERFVEALQTLTYSESTFLIFKDFPPKDTFEIAIKEYVLRRMSRGGLKRDFGWSDRLRGGKPGDINAWETALAQIPLISKRLQGVELTRYRAVELLSKFNNEECLIYADPPYLKETRTVKKAYDYEMDASDHIRLLNVLLESKAKIFISGYDSELYNNMLCGNGWQKHYRDIANHSGQTKTKQRRKECVWTNQTTENSF